MEIPEIQPSKPYAEAVDHEEFKQLRAEVAEKKAATTAEPAEKTPQTEEVKPVIASEPGTEKPVQEHAAPTGEKSAEDQIKELRKNGKHAAANKLMVEAATKAANDRAEKAERALEALKSQPAATPSPAVQPKPQAAATDAADPRPKAIDAKYAGADGYDKYLEDVSRWGARQEFHEQRTRSNAEQSQREMAQNIGTRIAAFKAAKPEHADFDAVTAGTWDEATKTGTGLYLTPPMIQFVRESDAAPAVLYHLGKNMAEHARIVGLSPVLQLAELGSLGRLITTPAANAAIPEKRKPAVTKAAPPPTTLGGADEPEPQPLAEAGSYEQFKAMRKARPRSAR